MWELGKVGKKEKGLGKPRQAWTSSHHPEELEFLVPGTS